MADPLRSKPAGAGREDALVALLRALREAPDAAAVLAAGVGALATDPGVGAWIAADARRHGQLEVVAASGAPDAVADVRAAPGAGVDPWRAACERAGMDLIAWDPLGAASLPGARLGIAVRAGGETTGIARSGACAEIALWMGATVDARADRASADRLRVVAGRVVWLEASRTVARTLRHDLANKLMGISFYASQLGDELRAGTANADEAGTIDDLVANSAALLEQLRRVWREPSEAEVAPLDPAMVVAGILPMLTAVAEPSALEVGSLEPVIVRASQRGLEEAVLALILDAREDAGPASRPIRIDVGVEQLAADNPLGLAAGRYAAVLVAAEADAGRGGISVDAPDAGIGDGSLPLPGEPGFGLALAACSARAWGGAVHVEATGGGTLTTILVPQAVSRRRRDAAAGDDEALGGDAGGEASRG